MNDATGNRAGSSGEPDATAVPGELENFMTCDPIAGELRWVGTHGKARAGAVAGCKGANGYVYLGCQGKRYLAHRLIWLFVHGRWPVGQIDHVNGDRADNRISNLREASSMKNMQNLRELRQSAIRPAFSEWCRHQEGGMQRTSDSTTSVITWARSTRQNKPMTHI